VDHRVEHSMWLTDGSAEGAPADPESPQLAPGDPAENADPLLADMPPMPGTSYAASGQEAQFTGAHDGPFTGQQLPYTGPDVPYSPAPTAGQDAYSPAPAAGQDAYSPAAREAGENGDGMRIPPYQPQVPPLPAQVPSSPGSGMAGMAAKVAAPFASLTKPKARPKKPARPARPATKPAARVAPSYRPGPTERIPAATATRPAPARTPANAPTRRAQLVLSRIEPWSVMKFSFMVSLVGWVILFVAVAALYYVLSKLGVFHSIQSTITDVTSSKGSAGSDATGQWFSASRILGYTMLVGAVNVVLITALATVGAVIYNLVTHLAGGIEVTLKETD
jgi:hypothetical protein